MKMKPIYMTLLMYGGISILITAVVILLLWLLKKDLARERAEGVKI